MKSKKPDHRRTVVLNAVRKALEYERRIEDFDRIVIEGNQIFTLGYLDYLERAKVEVEDAGKYVEYGRVSLYFLK